MITTIVLAAGYSKRMGQPKALLKIDNSNFLDSILTKLQKLNPHSIYIVLGKHSDIIKKNIHFTGKCYFLENKNPEKGQLSSLQKALIEIPNEVKGFLMVLVDHPLVSDQTYQEILSTAIQNPDAIIIPVYNKSKGHPVYFGCKYINELMKAPLEQGARFVVNNNFDEVIQLEVEDEAILIDIDTPEAYKHYISVEN